ncbi:hypothetical protein BC628DRAFT_1345848 [Trametes gibbosa]|nr:hypothetical protein BC628DRAFT_1345848 [Trametes gibbosa]
MEEDLGCSLSNVQALTGSSPPAALPAPTTVTTRSLRPRRDGARSSTHSSRASTAALPRSRSQSLVKSSQLVAKPHEHGAGSPRDGNAAPDFPNTDGVPRRDSEGGEPSCSVGRDKRARSDSTSAMSVQRRKTTAAEGISVMAVNVSRRTDSPISTSDTSNVPLHAEVSASAVVWALKDFLEGYSCVV